MGSELIPAHRRALLRISGGDIYARKMPGVAAVPVLVRDGYSMRVEGVSSVALRELRARELITWAAGDGTHPIELTDAGRATL